MNIGDQKFNDFLSVLASKEPVPGGGATSGILTALATSLGSMVIAYTEGKNKYADHQPLHDDCEKFLHAARIESMELAAADAESYASLNALWKLDKDDQKRLEQWEDAVEQAANVPIRTMELCHRVLLTLETMVGKTNKMLVSDLNTASILAKCSAEIAAVTARINIPLLQDNARKIELDEKVCTLESTCCALAMTIGKSCGDV
ncbi:MAG: cyclodeaminase/cyclohydrolase family protein [Planctomycetes bacterium]|nr:cyclodeaminase/cyclohydrolase family protein [Planctomycetota bacterium]